MRQRLLAVLAAAALAACSPRAMTLPQYGAPAVAPAPQKVAVDEGGRPLNYPLLDQTMPAFTAERAGGGMFTSGEFRDAWTVIAFWGVWCGDCRADAAHMAAFARGTEQDPALRFVTVHVDTRSDRWPSVQAYLREQGITYPVLMDPDRAIYTAFQLQWAPSYLVVDPQGVIRGFRTDLSREPAPEGGVKAFMKQIAELRRAQAG